MVRQRNDLEEKDVQGLKFFRVLNPLLQPGRLYVLDRGYNSYEFFQDIVDKKASFVCRIQNNAAYQVIETKHDLAGSGRCWGH